MSVALLTSLVLALVWGCAWLSVLTCLGAFLPRWTNAGALGLIILAWILLFGIVATLRPAWAGVVETVTRFLGPQDPMIFAEPTKPGRDLGPALYDLVWIFVPWVVGVAILNRRSEDSSGRRSCKPEPRDLKEPSCSKPISAYSGSPSLC